ncbi:hypothetical protein GGF46_001488 [Coemansia sp. RSA 552]|nr:hypothetical protein GGF46_001488 [Coemansia sp. RSA 552]
MQPSFAAAAMDREFFPSMAAHCLIPPADCPQPAQAAQPQASGAQAMLVDTERAMGVVFERKIVPKRSRDARDFDESGSCLGEQQRCQYYRNSIVPISAKRTKAVESQV